MLRIDVADLGDLVDLLLHVVGHVHELLRVSLDDLGLAAQLVQPRLVPVVEVMEQLFRRRIVEPNQGILGSNKVDQLTAEHIVLVHLVRHRLQRQLDVNVALFGRRVRRNVQLLKEIRHNFDLFLRNALDAFRHGVLIVLVFFFLRLLALLSLFLLWRLAIAGRGDSFFIFVLHFFHFLLLSHLFEQSLLFGILVQFFLVQILILLLESLFEILLPLPLLLRLRVHVNL